MSLFYPGALDITHEAPEIADEPGDTMPNPRWTSNIVSPDCFGPSREYPYVSRDLQNAFVIPGMAHG